MVLAARKAAPSQSERRYVRLPNSVLKGRMASSIACTSIYCALLACSSGDGGKLSQPDGGRCEALHNWRYAASRSPSNRNDLIAHAARPEMGRTVAERRAPAD